MSALSGRHILFVTQTAHVMGGVEVWVEYLAQALASRGNRVTVALVDGRFHQAEKYLAVHELPSSVLIRSEAGTAEGRVRAITRTIATCDPDIVVPVNIIDTYEAVRRLKRKGSRALLLAANHSLAAESFLDLEAYAATIDVVASPCRLACDAARAVAGIPGERVIYAQCGVAPRVAPMSPAATFRVLWAGRVTQPNKRARDLEGVMRELSTRSSDIEFEVVGDGDQLEYLRGALGSGVGFAGRLGHHDMYAHVYPNADALLITSDSETGPLVAWEAMMHALPVVTTRYLGLASEGSLLDERTALLAEVGDTKGLAEQLIRLARDPALRKRIGEAGLCVAEQRYSREASVEAWERAFLLALRLAATPGDTRGVRHSSGRLQRMVGARSAETIRTFMGRRALPKDAGDEWPHTFHAADPRISETTRKISELDRRPAPADR